MIKNMMDLFANPLFKKGFFDFFLKMQQEGIESAKKFWNATYDKNLFPNASDMFEKMVDFYIILGFVPRVKYDEILKENEKLRDENKFLRDTIKELQLTIFKEGGEKMQEAWGTIIDKQLEMNKEIAKNFFELFKQLHGNSD
jgi:regulator of replication initiation timing